MACLHDSNRCLMKMKLNLITFNDFELHVIEIYIALGWVVLVLSIFQLYWITWVQRIFICSSWPGHQASVEQKQKQTKAETMSIIIIRRNTSTRRTSSSPSMWGAEFEKCYHYSGRDPCPKKPCLQNRSNFEMKTHNTCNVLVKILRSRNVPYLGREK